MKEGIEYPILFKASTVTIKGWFSIMLKGISARVDNFTEQFLSVNI